MKLNKIQKIILLSDSIVNYVKPSPVISQVGNGIKFIKTSLFFPNGYIELTLTWKEIEQIQQAYKLRNGDIRLWQ